MTDHESSRNDWPPYSYVPGGPFPHPISDRDGHMFNHRTEAVIPIEPERWYESENYLKGVELFNRGYYWEAHEAWEGLWHAAGRRGEIADLMKALIKLAAAGVKVREAQPNGVIVHAGRAWQLLEDLNRSIGPRYLGLNLSELAAFALTIKEKPPTTQSLKDEAVAVVFVYQLSPEIDR
jgi:predicted metal-dependent hydrolase